MTRYIVIIILALALVHASCSERNPLEPEDTPPIVIVPDQDNLFSLLDPGYEGLGEVFAALSRGDSLGAYRELLAYFNTTDPAAAPHASFDDPVRSADEILDGWITLPPHPRAPLLEDPAWTEDPFHDSNWRFQYHAFRWPMALLYAWEETGNTEYLDRFLFLIEDYSRDNLGDRWPSTMTWYDMGAALRTENWLYSWRLLVHHGLLDRDRMELFLLGIRKHGYMLANVIRYDKETNHGIFHDRALLCIDVALPELVESGDWYALGYDRLDTQIHALVSEDGVYLEPSPSYHFFAYDQFRIIREFLTAAGRDLRPSAKWRIDTMMQFGALLLQPNGAFPMLGDCYERMPLEPYLGLDPWLDYVITEGAAGERPAVTCRSWELSGHTIVRSGWGEQRTYRDETHAVFDTGPKDGSHGHYDGMTFTLYAYGSKLIVDSGYYTFDGGWRFFFRSPEAHNVLVPADGSHGVDADPVQLTSTAGDRAYFRSAVKPLGDDLEWTRSFVFLEPSDILLVDRVTGPFEGPVDQLFHFPPASNVITGTDRLTVEAGGAHIDLMQARPSELLIIEGELNPKQGWYSPVYGVMEPNPVARFRNGDVAPSFCTLLHAHAGGDSLRTFRVVEETPGSSVLFHIERSSGSERVEVWTETGRVERRP
jgi:hypothetical protein